MQGICSRTCFDSSRVQMSQIGEHSIRLLSSTLGISADEAMRKEFLGVAALSVDGEMASGVCVHAPVCSHAREGKQTLHLATLICIQDRLTSFNTGDALRC